MGRLKSFADQNRDYFGAASLKDVATELYYNDGGGASSGESFEDWAIRKDFDRDIVIEEYQKKEAKRQNVLDAERKENLENRWSFTRGLSKGVDDTQALLYGAASKLGSDLQLDSLRDWGFEGYKRNLEESSTNPAKTDFRHLLSDPSADNAIDYIGHTAGSLLPTMATIFLGGGIAGAPLVAGGKIAGKRLLGKAIYESIGDGLQKKGIQKLVSNGIKESAAKTIMAKTVEKRVGLVAASTVLETGGLYGDSVEHFRQKYLEEGLTPAEAESRAFEEVSGTLASALGLASGFTELVGGNLRVFDKLWGTGVRNTIQSAMVAAKKSPNLRTKVFNTIRDIVKEGVKEAPGEFAQEATQEALGLLNLDFQDPDFEIMTSDSAWQLIEAGMAGAIGGVAGGALHSSANAIPGRAVKDASRQIIQLQERIANQKGQIAKGRSTPELEAALKRNKEALATAQKEASADADRMTYNEAAKLLNRKAPALSGKATTAKSIKKLVESGKLVQGKDGFLDKKSVTEFAEKRASRRVTIKGETKDLADVLSDHEAKELDRRVDIVTGLDTDRKIIKSVEPEIWDGEIGYREEDGNFVNMTPDQLASIRELFEDESAVDDIETTVMESVAEKIAKFTDREDLTKSEIGKFVSDVLNGRPNALAGNLVIEPEQIGLTDKELTGLSDSAINSIREHLAGKDEGELSLSSVIADTQRDKRKQAVNEKRETMEKERIGNAFASLIDQARSTLNEEQLGNERAVNAEIDKLLDSDRALREAGFAEEDIAAMADKADREAKFEALQEDLDFREVNELGGTKLQSRKERLVQDEQEKQRKIATEKRLDDVYTEAEMANRETDDALMEDKARAEDDAKRLADSERQIADAIGLNADELRVEGEEKRIADEERSLGTPVEPPASSDPTVYQDSEDFVEQEIAGETKDEDAQGETPAQKTPGRETPGQGAVAGETVASKKRRRGFRARVDEDGSTEATPDRGVTRAQSIVRDTVNKIEIRDPFAKGYALVHSKEERDKLSKAIGTSLVQGIRDGLVTNEAATALANHISKLSDEAFGDYIYSLETAEDRTRRKLERHKRKVEKARIAGQSPSTIERVLSEKESIIARYDDLAKTKEDLLPDLQNAIAKLQQSSDPKDIALAKDLEAKLIEDTKFINEVRDRSHDPMSDEITGLMERELGKDLTGKKEDASKVSAEKSQSDKDTKISEPPWAGQAKQMSQALQKDDAQVESTTHGDQTVVPKDQKPKTIQAVFDRILETGRTAAKNAERKHQGFFGAFAKSIDPKAKTESDIVNLNYKIYNDWSKLLGSGLSSVVDRNGKKPQLPVTALIKRLARAVTVKPSDLKTVKGGRVKPGMFLQMGSKGVFFRVGSVVPVHKMRPEQWAKACGIDTSNKEAFENAYWGAVRSGKHAVTLIPVKDRKGNSVSSKDKLGLADPAINTDPKHIKIIRHGGQKKAAEIGETAGIQGCVKSIVDTSDTVIIMKNRNGKLTADMKLAIERAKAKRNNNKPVYVFEFDESSKVEDFERMLEDKLETNFHQSIGLIGSKPGFNIEHTGADSKFYESHFGPRYEKDEYINGFGTVLNRYASILNTMGNEGIEETITRAAAEAGSRVNVYTHMPEFFVPEEDLLFRLFGVSEEVQTAKDIRAEIKESSRVETERTAYFNSILGDIYREKKAAAKANGKEYTRQDFYNEIRETRLNKFKVKLEKRYPGDSNKAGSEQDITLGKIARALVEDGFGFSGVAQDQTQFASQGQFEITNPRIKYVGVVEESAKEERIRLVHAQLRALTREGYLSLTKPPKGTYGHRVNPQFLAGLPDLASVPASAGSHVDVIIGTKWGKGSNAVAEIAQRRHSAAERWKAEYSGKVNPKTIDVISRVWGVANEFHGRLKMLTNKVGAAVHKAIKDAPKDTSSMPTQSFATLWGFIKERELDFKELEGAKTEAKDYAESRIMELYNLALMSSRNEWLTQTQLETARGVLEEIWDAAGVSPVYRPNLQMDPSGKAPAGIFGTGMVQAENLGVGRPVRIDGHLYTVKGVETGNEILSNKNDYLVAQVEAQNLVGMLQDAGDKPAGVVVARPVKNADGKVYIHEKFVPMNESVEAQTNIADLFPMGLKFSREVDPEIGKVSYKPINPERVKSTKEFKSEALLPSIDFLYRAKLNELKTKLCAATADDHIYSFDVVNTVEQTEFVKNEQTGEIEERVVAVKPKTEIVLTIVSNSSNARTQVVKFAPARLGNNAIEAGLAKIIKDLDGKVLGAEEFAALSSGLTEVAAQNGMRHTEENPLFSDMQMLLAMVDTEDMSTDSSIAFTERVQEFLSEEQIVPRNIVSDKELASFIDQFEAGLGRMDIPAKEFKRRKKDFDSKLEQLFGKERVLVVRERFDLGVYGTDSDAIANDVFGDNQNLQNPYSQGEKASAEDEGDVSGDTTTSQVSALDLVGGIPEETRLNEALDAAFLEGVDEIVSSESSKTKDVQKLWQEAYKRASGLIVSPNSIKGLKKFYGTVGNFFKKISLGEDSPGIQIGSMRPEVIKGLTDLVLSGKFTVITPTKADPNRALSRTEALALRVKAALQTRFVLDKADQTYGYEAEMTIAEAFTHLGINEMPTGLLSVEPKLRKKLIEKLQRDKQLCYAIGLDPDDAFYAAGINPHGYRDYQKQQEQASVSNLNRWKPIEDASQRIGESEYVDRKTFDEILDDVTAKQFNDNVIDQDVPIVIDTTDTSKFPSSLGIAKVEIMSRTDSLAPWDVGAAFSKGGMGSGLELLPDYRMMRVTFDNGKVATFLEQTEQETLDDTMADRMEEQDEKATGNFRVLSRRDLALLAERGRVKSASRTGNANRKSTARVNLGNGYEMVAVDMSASEITISPAEAGALASDANNKGLGHFWSESTEEMLRQFGGFNKFWNIKSGNRASTSLTKSKLTELVEPAEIQSKFEKMADVISHATGKIRVIMRMEDAPALIRREMEKLTPEGGMLRGLAADDGTVWIVLGAHADKNGRLDRKELLKTFVHETVGHDGLRNMMGERFTTFLDEVYAGFRDEIGMFVSRDNQHVATEEFLARMVETVKFNEKTGTFEDAKIGSYLDRFISMVMKPIRAIASMFGKDIKITRAEVRTALFNAFDGAKFKRAYGIAGSIPQALISGSNLPGVEQFKSWEENTADRFIARFIKSFKPVELYQKAVEMAGGSIAEHEDVDMYRQLMAGRTGAKISEIENGIEEKYVKQLRDLGIAHNDLARFAMARHASERNARLFEEFKKESKAWLEKQELAQSGKKSVSDLDKKTQDKIARSSRNMAARKLADNTAMSDSDAEAVLQRYKKRGLIDWSKDKNGNRIYTGRMAQAIETVDEVNDMALDYGISYGFIQERDRENMKQKFQYFMPGGPEEFSENFAVTQEEAKMATYTSPIKRFVARKQGGVDPVAMSILRLKQVVAKGEKNRVYKSLFDLIAGHPGGSVFEIHGDSYALGALKKMEGYDYENLKPTLIKQLTDENGNELYTPEENYIPVWLEGRRFFVRVKHNRLADALRAVDPPQANKFVRSVAKVNRWLIMTNTMLNPEFAFWSNPLRDIGTATANTALLEKLGVSDTTAAAKNVAKLVPSAINTLLVHSTGKSPWESHIDQEMLKYAKEFEAAGGKVGMPFVGNPEQISNQLRAKARRKDPKGGVINLTADGLKGLGKMLSGATEAVENGTRLSFYITAREAGVSAQKAAQGARNLTVDFNQRGELGQMMNTLYLFSNAGIQGTTRVIQSIRNNPQKAVKLIGGIVAASFVMAEMARLGAGDDDDGENAFQAIDRGTRNSHMILMFPGSTKGLKLPVPYGYGFFWAMGQKMSELMHGEVDSLDAAGGMFDDLLNNFNPLGSAGELRSSHDWIRTATPTLVDPLIDIAFEKTPFGTPLMPGTDLIDHPDSQRHWSTVSPVNKKVAQWLNNITGGSASKPGFVDVSPESLDLLATEATGGSIAFIRRTLGYFTRSMNGLETSTNQIPMIRRMVAEPSEYKHRGDLRNAMNTLKSIRYKQKDLENSVAYAKVSSVKRQAQKDLAEFNKKYHDLLVFKKRADKMYSRIKDFDAKKEKWIKSGLSDVEIKRRLQNLSEPQRGEISNFLREFNAFADAV